ncbi:S-type pyocin domain-containing protein [Pseudomonas azerbaijanoccidentalis]
MEDKAMSEKQGPPHHIPATHVVGEHGSIELPATYIGKQPKPGKDAIGGGFRVPPTRPGGMGSGITHAEGLRRETRDNIKATEASVKNEYAAKFQDLPRSTEVDLANVRAHFPAPAVSVAQAYQHELNVRNILIQQKSAEFHTHTVLANAFYGHSPLNTTIGDYLARAQALDKTVTPYGPAYSKWVASYKSAFSAKLLTEQIQLLNNQQVHIQNLHASALMQEQRAAAEQARIEAEAEVQRQAELQRLEDERQAHLETMAAPDAVQGIRPFPVSGAAAANGAVFAVGAGTLAVDAATTIAIGTAVRSAVAAAITASAAVVGTASGAVIVVGVAALVYYALRDKQEPHTLSFPLSDLTTYDADGLYAIAESSGEIELPVALGSKTTENTTEFVVAAANGTAVPDKVPVRLATYDPVLNVYSAHHPDAPGIGMTWTPIVRPVNESTVLPVHEPNLVAYEGATLTALEGRIDTSPALDLYSFGGFIYVFPIESGIAPQYVMVNSPYDGAVVEGEHSGRDFNPEQTGGEVLEGEWEPAIASQEGIHIVKLHASKFPQSDANDVMIDRLERVLRGELEMTDTDKRFYTHEIREFERFKALGYGDTEMPDPDSPVWNNVHTATLEDFKLKDDPSLLYTPEALAAGKAQDEREYQKLLKEMWQ